MVRNDRRGGRRYVTPRIVARGCHSGAWKAGRSLVLTSIR